MQKIIKRAAILLMTLCLMGLTCMAATTKGPFDTVSVGEALTAACRLYGTSVNDDYARTIAASNDSYSEVVAYAVDKNIISAGTYTTYTQKVTRIELVRFFYPILSEDKYTAINNISKITDMSTAHADYAAALAMCRAGILRLDENGRLNPYTGVTQSEFAGMLSRMGIASRREEYTAATSAVDTRKQAFRISATSSLNASKEGLQSGWELDNRAGTLKTTLDNNAVLTDVMTDEKSRMIRYFERLTDDKIELRTYVSYSISFNGNVLEFCDEDDTPTYRLVTRNDSFCIQKPDGTYTTIYSPTVHLPIGFRFRIIIDLGKGTSTTYINNVNYGTHPLIGDAVRYFAYSTTEESENVTQIGDSTIFANYAVNENLDIMSGFPCDMTKTGSTYVTGGYFVVPKNSSFSKSFEPTEGKITFNFNAYVPSGSNGATFALKSAGNTVARFTITSDKLYGNDTYLRDLSNKLWFKLRIEADPFDQTATFKANGKVIGTVPFLKETGSFDSITFENLGATNIKIDDIQVYNLVDYDVPAPVIPAGADNYTIGVNVCSLWVNGDHFGWACVSPYDDMTPILGYYDEGLPESADWENKYMAEHGIDFQAFCWYANEINAPMKKTRLSDQLDDAYLHSKYGDQVSFCLLWEAGNGARPYDSNAFRNYYVPYWMENYFSDPRYMSIDNKLIFSIFGVDDLIKAFGTDLKAEFDYMREQVKTLGYDGMIITASHTGMKDLSQYGFDGWQAYNWGSSGYSYDTNVSNNLNRQSTKDVYVIPTISVGFNSIPWHGVRYPLMSVADFEKTAKWVRDTYLPTYSKSSNWTHNLLWLSTWNEFGEGTYIMPASGLNGFGYLDKLRSVYTKGGSHTDVVPTAEQKKNFNHLYPQDRRLLRNYGNYVVPGSSLLSSTTYSLTTSGAYNNVFTISNMGSNPVVKTDSNGTTLRTSSTNPDAALYIKSSLYSNLLCEQVERIRVVASGIPTGQFMQLFYQTPSVTTWKEKNSVKAFSTSTAEATYTFDMRGAPDWSGTIKALRLDPLELANTQFTIKSISIDTAPVFPFTTAKAYDNYFSYISGLSTTNSVVKTDENGTTFRTSSTKNPDVIFSFKSDLFSKYTCATLDSIRLVASGIPAGEKVQLFYTTDGATNLSEANSIIIYSTGPEERTYDFKLAQKSGWTGKIRSLRLDPLQIANTDFTIKSITFLPVTRKLFINNYEVQNVIQAQLDSAGNYFFPFEPGKSLINFLLYTYHEWDYSAKTLKLYRDNKCVTFTVGSNIADIDGTPYTLVGKVYQVDNIPMLPMESVAKIFGFTYQKSGNDYYITTPEKKIFESSVSNVKRVPGEWEFNVLGDSEGWTSSYPLGYGSGTLNLALYDSTSPDPSMFSPSALGFSCSDYSKVEIRCRWDADRASEFGFYFITDEDQSWNQDKFVGTYVAKDSGGEFVTMTFNMAANEGWTGTLRQLRFDPFNANGLVEIDYIKLIK